MQRRNTYITANCIMSRCDGILEFFLINFLRMISLVRVQEAVSSNSRARGWGGGGGRPPPQFFFRPLGPHFGLKVDPPLTTRSATAQP